MVRDSFRRGLQQTEIVYVKAAVMAALLLLLYSDKHIDVNIRKQHALISQIDK